MSELRLLAPPYRQLAWSTDGVPSLGTLAVVAADSPESVAGLLRPVLQRAPWCVPCLITGSATATPLVLIEIHDLPGQPAFVGGPLEDDALLGPALHAVRNRPIPGGARLADYVVRRTGRAELRFELANLLGLEPPELIVTDLPERTLRDRLRRFGVLGSHCWRAVGALCRLAARQDGGSVERLAMNVGVGPRTLRSWVRRYLEVTMATFRSRIGWEWVIEAALRTGGYVEAPRWTKPFALRPSSVTRANSATPPSLVIGPPRGLRRWARSITTEAAEIPLPDPANPPGPDATAPTIRGGEDFD